MNPRAQAPDFAARGHPPKAAALDSMTPSQLADRAALKQFAPWGEISNQRFSQRPPICDFMLAIPSNRRWIAMERGSFAIASVLRRRRGRAPWRGAPAPR